MHIQIVNTLPGIKFNLDIFLNDGHSILMIVDTGTSTNINTLVYHQWIII